MKQISLEEAEYIAHELAIELFSMFDEPMPDFNTRFPGRLESCLKEPFQSFNGQELHGNKITDKAAVLFYLIIKNHPFENGNKRMAVTLMLVFLFKNGYWLKTTPEELYKLALTVASDKPSSKESSIKALKEVFTKFLIRRRKSI